MKPIKGFLYPHRLNTRRPAALYALDCDVCHHERSVVLQAYNCRRPLRNDDAPVITRREKEASGIVWTGLRRCARNDSRRDPGL